MNNDNSITNSVMKSYKGKGSDTGDTRRHTVVCSFCFGVRDSI